MNLTPLVNRILHSEYSEVNKVLRVEHLYKLKWPTIARVQFISPQPVNHCKQCVCVCVLGVRPLFCEDWCELGSAEGDSGRSGSPSMATRSLS